MARQYLPSVNLSVANTRMTDFFSRRQQWIVQHVLGEDVEDMLEASYTPVSDEFAELRQLVQRVIAEGALLDATPELDMQLTEAGFAVQKNDNFTPASSQRVDRLLARMPQRIANDVDAVVKHLMANSTGDSLYDNWRGSRQFAYLTSAFMPLFEDFCRLVGKEYDWNEYYLTIEPMAREMRHVADYYVSTAEIDSLLEKYRDNELIEVQRKAIAELRVVGAACIARDSKRAVNAAAQARKVMMQEPGSFPAFKASEAYANATVNIDAGNVVSFV